jgi:hypothetical protein
VLYLRWYALNLFSIYPKEFKARSSRYICIPMFIAALFITMKIQKQPQVSINRKMGKQNEINAHNAILLSFKKEVLTYDIYLSICVYEPSEHYTK